MKVDVRDGPAVARAIAGAAAVVNAVSLYRESRNVGFSDIHVDAARRVAEAAREHGVARLVHLSGIGSDPGSSSPYIRARGEGEVAVRDAFTAVTILRPSAMFGPDDPLITALLKVTRLPIVPLFGGGDTRLQPVFVGDVAEASARLVAGDAEPEPTYEFGGSDILTYRELVELTLRATGRRRPVVPVPFAVWEAMAAGAQFLPTSPITEGQSVSGSIRLVAGVGEVVSALGGREGVEPLGDGTFEGGEGAGGRLAQERLQLGEGLLDRVEVGAVGRQEEQRCAGLFDRSACRRHLVGRQVIEHDNVARDEGWHEQALDPSGEGRAVHGAVDQHRRGQPVEPQSGDEGCRLPVAVRDRRPAALAAWAAAAQARHLGRSPGLVDEDEPRGIEVGLVLKPGLALGLHVDPVLLAGVRRLFLNVTPWRR